MSSFKDADIYLLEAPRSPSLLSILHTNRRSPGRFDCFCVIAALGAVLCVSVLPTPGPIHSNAVFLQSGTPKPAGPVRLSTDRANRVRAVRPPPQALGWPRMVGTTATVPMSRRKGGAHASINARKLPISHSLSGPLETILCGGLLAAGAALGLIFRALARGRRPVLRVLRAAALGPAAEPHSKNVAVCGTLVGQPMYQSQDGSGVVVPLLHPATAQIPLAMGLQLYTSPAAGAAPSLRALTDAWELHYIVEGEATLVTGGLDPQPCPHGEHRLHLKAGDSVCIPPGIRCRLEPAPSSRALLGVGDTRDWELASLVAHLPDSVVGLKTQPAGQPGEAGVAAAARVAERVWQDGGVAGHLTDEQVTLLLSGACRRHGKEAGRPAAPAGGTNAPAGAPPAVIHRALDDVVAFQMPNQSNRIALVFDPISITNLNATFGVEVFGPGHITPQHQHEEGHELFFILSGSGVAECNGHRFEVGRGDVVVFPPKSVHGIDNLPDAEPLYCLELMLPNDMFSEFVRSGQPVGMLNAQDICTLINFGCGQLEQGSAHPQAQHEL